MGFVGYFGGLKRHVGRRRTIVCSVGTDPDVVVVGGGGVGLSTALEVALNGGKAVVVGFNRDAAATRAAAGMLAPQAERLEDGPLLSLSLRSRELYPSYIEALERMSSVEVPFDNSGRFLGPRLDSDTIMDSPPPSRSGVSEWLDRSALQCFEPMMSDEVNGAWLYGGDCSVDNRALSEALSEACKRAGVDLIDAEVTGISLKGGGKVVDGVSLKSGQVIRAGHFVIAAGSWTRKLLAVPVRPVKGQMLRLKPVAGVAQDANTLRSVLYGESVYVVPRRDGSIVVGATVEDVGFSAGVTAGGISSMLNAAVRLVPALSQYELVETWFGYRPTTPDLQPILGSTRFANCSVATGHHRNGILLLPITAKIMANVAAGKPQADAELEELLPAFHADRFKNPVASHIIAPSTPSFSKAAATRDKVNNKPMNGFANFVHEEGLLEKVLMPGHDSADVDDIVSGFHPKEEQKKWKDEILVWKVEEDGRETPIRFKQGVDAFEKGYGDTQAEEEARKEEMERERNTFQDLSSLQTPSEQVQARQDRRREEERALQQRLQEYERTVQQRRREEEGKLQQRREEERAALSRGMTPDAYDDILHHRGANDAEMERLRSETLMRNRTFAVESSRVNEKGQKLCISDSEFDMFEAAAMAGSKEADAFRKAWRRRNDANTGDNEDTDGHGTYI